jgi:hypothetical protein
VAGLNFCKLLRLGNWLVVKKDIKILILILGAEIPDCGLPVSMLSLTFWTLRRISFIIRITFSYRLGSNGLRFLLQCIAPNLVH